MNMDPASEEKIIKSILNGKTDDFTLIIKEYKDKAYSLVKKILKNEFDAEETLQDAFLKAFNSLGSFRGDSKFSTWLYRIVYNEAMTRLSSKNKKIEALSVSIDEEIEMFECRQISDYEISDAAELLNKLIAGLPPKYSAALNLFYQEGFSYDEIADIMGIALSNVKIILHRSRKALKDVIIKKNLQKELV